MDTNNLQPEPVVENIRKDENLPKTKKYTAIIFSLLILVVLGGIFLYFRQKNSLNLSPSNQPVTTEGATPSNTNILASSSTAPTYVPVAMVNVPFAQQDISISPEVSKSFSIKEIQNLYDMEKAYGFTFSPEELQKLEQNKFVMKNLLDTNLGDSVQAQMKMREFVALYLKIMGDGDYKSRTQANSVFISSDALLNLFSILSVELLKETENKYLYDDTLKISKLLYEQSSARLASATADADRHDWTKVRNYFAVPYALLSTAQMQVSAGDYWNTANSRGQTVQEFQADFQAKDKNFDSYDNAVLFIKNLHIDSQSESDVLADIKSVYDASGSDKPKIFLSEYQNIPGDIDFKVPFALFKPRGTYTSSSLRRQYFRAVQWYQQIPFFLSSKELTNYALDIGQLMGGSPDATNQYNSLTSVIGYLIGQSDDLDVGDYAQAVSDLGVDGSHDQGKLAEYLGKKKPGPMIKSLPATYTSVGKVSVSEVLAATRGMRFMSQKFVPDSYWTGKVTQGDEAPAVNGMKLPDMASSLEVMSILGSPYATDHLPDLDFYPSHKQAIDTKLADLKTEASGWGDKYWMGNLYTNTLWSISGLFDWLDTNRAKAPEFMRSPLWGAKTVLTGSGFWTELRHTSILYAKQSFAEKGGGGGDSCDERKVPEPPKGYIEPQPEAYDRLYYMAQRLSGEYKARGYDLTNLKNLDTYSSLVNIIREYSKLELENTVFDEPVISKTRHSDDDNKDCVEYFISPDATVKRGVTYWDPASRWEEIRASLIQLMSQSLPEPIEGPILPIKDKRTAVVADVHTGMEGQVLEEGTGVPRVIFVAVKDANGPRLTIGLTYSQYEFVSPSDRLTDEDWQQKFYTDTGDDSITYKPKSVWPNTNKWYQELLGTK